MSLSTAENVNKIRSRLAIAPQSQVKQPQHGVEPFVLLDDLKNDNADTSVILIMPNQMRYAQESNVPLFQATNFTRFPNEAWWLPSDTWWLPSEPASLIICTEQFQMCNPTINLTTRCTEPAGLYSLNDTNFERIQLNAVQKATAYTLSENTRRASLSDTIGLLREHHVLDVQKYTFNDLIQFPLPSDQWIREISRWFDIALMQTRFVLLSIATGPRRAADTGLSKRNMTAPYNMLNCGRQRVQIAATGSVTFSATAVILIFLGGLMISVMGVSSPSILLQRYKRTKSSKQKQGYLQWMADDKLQLARMVNEAAGEPGWIGGRNAIPVNTSNTPFGRVECTEIGLPQIVAAEDLKHEGKRTESMKLNEAGTNSTEQTELHTVGSG
jgi:hypothetical protein